MLHVVIQEKITFLEHTKSFLGCLFCFVFFKTINTNQMKRDKHLCLMVLFHKHCLYFRQKLLLSSVLKTRKQFEARSQSPSTVLLYVINHHLIFTKEIQPVQMQNVTMNENKLFPR